MEEDEVAAINFIPCLCFIPRGVAKENPEKVTLTQEELARVIADTKAELKNIEADEDEDNEAEMEMSDTEKPGTSKNENVKKKKKSKSEEEPSDDAQTITEFDLDDYDDDVAGPQMSLADIAVIDPNENMDDEEDSDAEDDLIKPTDNLILVGHVENDCSSLEVYIYNEEEGSLYVHHDFLLPAYPLCIEWLSHDPSSEKPGNLCAIGSMDPVITVWDIDIQDSLEPAFKLGTKSNKKKKQVGHTDAVLDLSWNQQLPHILASSSVDQSVILWDLDNGEPNTIIKAFSEKVQTISFHPIESQHLLAGCCDGIVKLFDCRYVSDLDKTFKSWKLDTEIERVCWNTFDSNYFMASTNSGFVHYIDIRKDNTPLWSQKCHDQETTGLVLSSQISDMLTTTSADGLLKVWDINTTEAKLIYTQSLKIGQIQCLAGSPENPFTMAVGGDFTKKFFKVVDLIHEEIQKTFGNRPRVNRSHVPETVEEESME